MTSLCHRRDPICGGGERRAEEVESSACAAAPDGHRRGGSTVRRQVRRALVPEASLWSRVRQGECARRSSRPTRPCREHRDGHLERAAIIRLANEADDQEEDPGIVVDRGSRRDYSNVAKPSGAGSRTG